MWPTVMDIFVRSIGEELHLKKMGRDTKQTNDTRP